MISNIGSVLVSLVGGISSFLTPSAGGEGSILDATAVASIAVLFGVPVAIAVGKKAVSLVKSIKG